MDKRILTLKAPRIDKGTWSQILLMVCKSNYTFSSFIDNKTKFGLVHIQEYLFMMVKRLKILVNMMDFPKANNAELFQDSNGKVWACQTLDGEMMVD